jgi:hypothetical protein
MKHFFKLVPVAEAELKEGQPFVVTWSPNRNGDGYTLNLPSPNFSRHILTGSASVFNLDTLIAETQ